jgi:ABC-type phosphate transport system substrate-binding protein
MLFRRSTQPATCPSGVALLILCALAPAAIPSAAGAAATIPAARVHAGAQHAQRQTAGLPTPVFAGGGAVPALTLRAWGNTFGVTPGQPAPANGFNVEMLYASSTGGSGQRYFINGAFDSLSAIAANPAFTDVTNGRSFLYPYAGSPDYAIGSQLSNADMANYNTLQLSARGKPLIVPVVENPQALGFNLGPNSTLGSRSLTLSRQSYCGIFTGTISSWDNAQITADNGGVPVVSAPTTIDVVYRSDGSGTTFMLTDHLHDVCPPAGVPWNQGVGETFTVPSPVPPGSSFVAAKGGAAAVAAVENPIAGHGAISYLTAAQVQPLSPTGPPASLVINRAGYAIPPTAQGAYEAVRYGPFAAPPPGYPATNPNTYITNPAAADAYPIVGMVIMYFYGCYSFTDPTIYATAGFFTASLFPTFGGPPSSYDALAQANGVGQLPDLFKFQVLGQLFATQLVPQGGTCSQRADVKKARRLNARGLRAYL